MACPSRTPATQSGGVLFIHGVADAAACFRDTGKVVLHHRPGEPLARLAEQARAVAAGGFDVLAAFDAAIPPPATQHFGIPSVFVFEPLTSGSRCLQARSLRNWYHLLAGTATQQPNSLGFLRLEDLRAAFARAAGDKALPRFADLCAALGLGKSATGVYLQPRNSYSAVLHGSASAFAKREAIDALLRTNDGRQALPLRGSSFLLQWLWNLIPFVKRYTEPYIFVINLDRRPDRLDGFRSQLDRQGLSFTRFSAVDGKTEVTIPEADVTTTWNTRINSRYDFSQFHPYSEDILEMSRSERACAESHLRVWQTILDKGLPYGVIFEDDAELVPDFKARLEVVMKDAPSEWDVIYLGYWLPDQGSPDPEPRLFGATQTSELFKPSYLWWLIGYVMSSSGAKKAITELPIHAPVDNFLGELVLENKLDAWAVKRPIVHANNAQKSNIHHTVGKGDFHGPDAGEDEG